MRLVLARGKILVNLEKAASGQPLSGKVVHFAKGRQLECGRESDLGVSLQLESRLILSKAGEPIDIDGQTLNLIDYNDVIGMYPQKPPVSASVTNHAKQDPPKITLPKPEALPPKVVA